MGCIDWAAAHMQARVLTRGLILSWCAAAAGWDVTKAVTTLVRKSGWKGPADDALRRSISLTRYQSTTYTLSYVDYMAMRSPEREDADDC
jgi:hypothetical protein